MEWLSFIQDSPAAFIFAFARVGALVFVAPVFGSRHLPLRLRLGLSIVIALFAAPLVNGVVMPSSTPALLAMLAGEVMTGVVIGFAVRLVFAGVEYAGQVASVQMSLGLGNVYDPASGTTGRGVTEFFSIFAILVFLGINGHLMIISALTGSFDAVPAGGFGLTPEFMEHIVVLSREIFIVALKLSAPVIAISLFVNAACAIVARSVPDMDVRAVSVTVSIVAGLFVILLSLPSLAAALTAVFDRVFDGVFLLIREMNHAA